MVGQRTVEVADVFDVRAARALSEAVALLAAGERVIVDCRGVRHFEDRALPLLAGALRDRAGQVSLRGLGEHQWRVLGYLGVARAEHAPGGDHGDEGGAVPVAGGAGGPQEGAPARETGEGA